MDEHFKNNHFKEAASVDSTDNKRYSELRLVGLKRCATKDEIELCPTTPNAPRSDDWVNEQSSSFKDKRDEVTEAEEHALGGLRRDESVLIHDGNIGHGEESHGARQGRGEGVVA